MANPTLQGLLNANNPQTGITGAQLQNISSAALFIGSALSNVTGDGAGGGYRYARLHLHISSITPSAGGTVYGWFLTAADGSTYEQGGTSLTPARAPDFVFAAINTAAAVDLETYVQMPICATFKMLCVNNLGVSTANDTNGYIKIYYETDMYPNV